MAYKPGLIAEYYTKYKNHKLVLNKTISRSIGIKINNTTIKCLDENYHCILYQTTLVDAKILIKAQYPLFSKLNKVKNIITLHITLIDNDNGKDVPIYIHCKVSRYHQYTNDTPGIYFFSLDFLNKPPDDYIKILSEYIERETKHDRRITERIVISCEHNTDIDGQPIETYLFTDGKGKKCILSEISILSAKVLIKGFPSEYEKKKIILLMKTNTINKMCEMIGDVIYCDYISEKEQILSLIILFDQDSIPPTYKMWIGQCIERIKLKNK